MGIHSKLAAGLLLAAGILALPAGAGAVVPGPNGDIAFVSGRGGGDAQADVYFLDGPNGTISGPLSILAGQHRHPNYAPDGKRIAYALWESAATRDIWIRDVDGDNGIRLDGGTPNVQDDRPAWSPNGKKIAYESEATAGSGQQDILVTNVTNGNTTNLTSDMLPANTDEGKPVWSPDGDQIYYSSDRFGDPDIFREPSNNSSDTPTPILISATHESQPALSPDGTQLCYLRGPYGAFNTDIYVVPSSGAGPPGVDVSDNVGTTMASHADYNCAWSPDGTRILFVKGTFSNGMLMQTASDGSDTPSLATPELAGVNNTVFDGNPDWRPTKSTCRGKIATIAGGDGPQTLMGTPGNDVILGHKGNDTVIAQGGNDTICGGAGGDDIKGNSGKDRLFGEKGRDDLNGGPDKDECDGGPENDSAKQCEVLNDI